VTCSSTTAENASFHFHCKNGYSNQQQYLICLSCLTLSFVLGVINNKVLKTGSVFAFIWKMWSLILTKSVRKRQFLSLVTSSTFRGKQIQFPSRCVMKTEMMNSAQNVMKCSSGCCCRSSFVVYRSKFVCSFAAADFADMMNEGT
jgi:hypothetical protein